MSDEPNQRQTALFSVQPSCGESLFVLFIAPGVLAWLVVGKLAPDATDMVYVASTLGFYVLFLIGSIIVWTFTCWITGRSRQQPVSDDEEET